MRAGLLEGLRGIEQRQQRLVHVKFLSQQFARIAIAEPLEFGHLFEVVRDIRDERPLHVLRADHVVEQHRFL